MLAIGLPVLLKVGEFIVSSAVKIIAAVKGKGDASPKSEPPHPKFKDIEHIRRQEREGIAASKAHYQKLKEQQEKPK